MKISIALATYNGERYLKEQLESINSQTIKPDEVIFCDDASTDSTINIIKDFKNSVPYSCQIIKNIEKKGASVSFKRAIDFCKGDIIFFCDQDDVWMPNKIELMEKEFLNNPNIDFVISDALIVDNNLENLGYTLWQQRKFNKYWQHKFLSNKEINVFLKKNIITGMTTAISSNLKEIGDCKPEQVYHDAWYIYIASINNMHGSLIREPLVKYRQHENQQFGALKKNLMLRIKNYYKNYYFDINKSISILDPLIQYCNNHDLNSEASLEFLNKYKYLKRRKSILIDANYKSFFRILYEIFNLNYLKYGSINDIPLDLLFNIKLMVHKYLTNN